MYAKLKTLLKVNTLFHSVNQIEIKRKFMLTFISCELYLELWRIEEAHAETKKNTYLNKTIRLSNYVRKCKHKKSNKKTKTKQKINLKKKKNDDQHGVTLVLILVLTVLIPRSDENSISGGRNSS